MKRVIIVHQWGASPDRDWYPWLHTQLEAKGYDVMTPAMPNPDVPEIGAWVSALAQSVGSPNKDTILVGHSVGCQTILRYLTTFEEGEKVGKVILVAPWLKLSDSVMQDPAYGLLAKYWLETPIDWMKVQTAAGSFTCFFSQDDPYVPIENAEMFKNKLRAEIIIEDGMGHYEDDSNIKEVPNVLNKVLKLASNT